MPQDQENDIHIERRSHLYNDLNSDFGNHELKADVGDHSLSPLGHVTEETRDVASSTNSEIADDAEHQDQDDAADADDEDDGASEPLELYPYLGDNVFKTANRIIDDIRADLSFILSRDPEIVSEGLSNGLLRLLPISYAKRLSELRHLTYDLVFLNDNTDFAPTLEQRFSKFEPRDRIIIIRGLLYSMSEPSLARSKVYHVKILCKDKYWSDPSATKNEFHLVDDLQRQDALDLIEYENTSKDDPIRVQNSLPHLVDEANYVCEITNRIIRVEISEPEFDHEDLYDYEIGPINVRYTKALDIYPDLSENIPSPALCLHTLFKAIRGPLLLKADQEQRTINATNKSLNSFINPAILIRNLQFELENDEFKPPNISNLSDPRSSIIRESYMRKILEVMLLGKKSYSGNGQNPFNNYEFTNNLKIFFHAINDKESWKRHTSLVQDESYINISAYPFYSDDLIMFCYNHTVKADPRNLPVYFDSLRDLANKRSNFRLSNYVAQLSSLNIIGKKEIDNAYKSLSVEPENAENIKDDILLTMYETEAALHPLDSKLRNALKTLAEVRNSEKLKRFLAYEPLSLNQAYDILEIDSTVDDDVVSTAAIVKKSDSPNDTQLFNRAFLTIASERKSFELLDQIERECPDIYEPISFKDACEYLGIDEKADEFQILSIFQMGQREIKKARNALRTIGQAKNSKLIESFLKTRLIDHNLLPADNWPVGLNNIGNTCYLNSLLQYYFSIKPLRDAVLEFNDTYSGDEIYKNRRIGGRFVGEGEIERSFQFVYQLRDLFFELIHSDRRCVTPKKELAFLAFLPSVTDVEFEKIDDTQIENVDQYGISADLQPTSDDDLIDLSSATANNDIDLIDLSEKNNDELGQDDVIVVDDEGNPSHDSGAMEVDSPDKASEKKETKSKAAKISEAEMETAYEIGRQQDVTECIGNVLSQIEAATKPEGFDELDNEQQDIVKDLFYGKTVQHLTDKNNPEIKRDKLDRFSNLFVNITDEPKDIYDAFDLFYKSEEVTIDGGPFSRSERITQLPIILQIQIQRVYFDKVALRPFKSIRPLPFPEILYMDRYIDTDNDEIITRRQDVENWRNEIKDLLELRDKYLEQRDNGISVKDALKSTIAWLNENKSLAQSTTIEFLEKRLSKIDEELLESYQKRVELEKSIDHHFDKFQEHGYKIFAIFIHRGEANYGHYWIYIKDSNRNIYRKYNDEIVSEVTSSEVFNFEEGNTATPYFLGYVKIGHEDAIEPLCRVLTTNN